MSAGGKALAESLGQFGTGVQELGKTLYGVEADNLYRVGTLDILDKIGRFNDDITQNPDHGTPGQNDGYMKLWNDYEGAIRKDLGSVKNVLAKKNLESFLGQAAVKQRSAVADMQLKGWKITQKSYLAKELDATKADATLSTDQKLGAVSNALASYKSKSIIDDAEEYELAKSYTQEIIKDDYVQGAMQAYGAGGFSGYKDYVKQQSPVSRMVGGVAYRIDTSTISTANAVIGVLSQPNSEAALKSYNTIKTTLASLQKDIASGLDLTNGTFETSFSDLEKEVQGKREELGTSYDTIVDEMMTVYVSHRKALSTKNRAGYEQKILAAIDTNDPDKVKNSVSDEDIWANCTADDASYLVKLKISGKKDATTEQQAAGVANLTDLYSVNSKLKRGGTLAEGESPLSRETLKTLLNGKKISESDYSKYMLQLDADDADSSGMKAYWGYRDAIDSGKFDLAKMQADKSLPFNMQLSLADTYAKKTSNTELARVQKMSLNLRRVMQGEKLGDNDEIISYAALDQNSPDYIKDEQARSVAYAALSSSVDFYRQRGKSEEYLRVVDSIVKGKITDGTALLTDATITDPANRVELYNFFTSYTRQEKSWARDDENWEYTKTTRTKAELQQHNAHLIQQKFNQAYDTFLGKNKGEAVTWDQFREYVSGFDENALDTSVAKTYTDLANNYQAGQAGSDLARRIRAKGTEWVDSGAYDQATYDSLAQEIETAQIPNKDDFRDLLERYKSNSISAGRAATTFAQSQADQKKQEYQQSVADRVMGTFKSKLRSDEGISDDEMETLRQDLATNAPDLYNRNWSLIEAMRAGRTNIQFWKNYNVAMDAMREHENAKTIDGYQLTGEELTHELINTLFPSDSQDDVKAKEYWGGQLDKFDSSQAAIPIEVDKETDLLSRARSNSWAALLGVGETDPDAGYLTGDSIDSATHLTGAQRAAFRDDLDSINRAISAKQLSDANSKAGIAPSPGQIQAGKDSLQFLKSMANVYKNSLQSYASLPALSYVDRNGTTRTIEYTKAGYMAYLAAHAEDLAAAGVLDEATKGISDMTAQIDDPVWGTVKQAIVTAYGKNKLPPPDVQKWIDSEIQNTKPTPEAAAKLAAAVRKKGIDIQLDSTFKLYTGGYDVSEKYLEAAWKGDLDPYMATRDGIVVASNKEFQVKLDGFAARTLDAFNEVLPSTGALQAGVNCVREDYENGIVMYRITNTGILSRIGFSGSTSAKSAKAYMGFLGKDAVPVVEVQRKDGSVAIRAWSQAYNKDGEWVDAKPYRDSDGIIRLAKASGSGPATAAPNVPTYSQVYDATGFPLY